MCVFLWFASVDSAVSDPSFYNHARHSSKFQVGEVFVEFGDPDGSNKAALALRNRQLSGRTVTCSFLDEAKYIEGALV